MSSSEPDKLKVLVGYSADEWHKETEDFEDFEEYLTESEEGSESDFEIFNEKPGLENE